MGKSMGPLQVSLEESIPFLTILTIIGATSIATNLLIVAVICKNSRTMKTYDLFTLHSSLVDLLTGMIVIPFWILSAVHSQIDFVGDIYCRISATVSLVELAAPVMFLTLVAASRHCSIVDSKAFPRIFSDFRSRLMILFVWVFSLIISIPPHFTWPISPEVLCLPDLISNSWYTMAVLSFCLLLPLCAGFYSHIHDIFLFQPERMKRSDSRRKLCERFALRGREKTTQKALFSILIIHTFCWAPYTFVAMAQALNDGKVFYTGNLPLHFIALIVGLTGTTLKGLVSCFEVPHLKELIRKQFGCSDHDENSAQEGQANIWPRFAIFHSLFSHYLILVKTVLPKKYFVITCVRNIFFYYFLTPADLTYKSIPRGQLMAQLNKNKALLSAHMISTES